MMINMALMDTNNPYCAGVNPILATVNTDKVDPQFAISKNNSEHKTQKTISVLSERNCFR